MKNTLLVFLGSGVGGVCRFWASYFVYALLGRSFPAGTLFVNVTGSFIMGLLFTLFLERASSLAPVYQPLFLIGVLGGYTTFSSFSIETFNLFESGNYTYALANIALSLVLTLAAVSLGVLLGRHL